MIVRFTSPKINQDAKVRDIIYWLIDNVANIEGKRFVRATCSIPDHFNLFFEIDSTEEYHLFKTIFSDQYNEIAILETDYGLAKINELLDSSGFLLSDHVRWKDIHHGN